MYNPRNISPLNILLAVQCIHNNRQSDFSVSTSVVASAAVNIMVVLFVKCMKILVIGLHLFT